ncbi:MFS transporter [Mitsuaria sp. GD03876]|uniref:MFS transporter n=1 Tax=Mitsuaria sp. GD03876 TaxID=2975399 RepID=UPI00244CFC62|nr:MFS transporter [Mitsuaria sp. GD03876]MDH0868283.1 MFS transporter [Mitsuaria sp. GD03876]
MSGWAAGAAARPDEGRQRAGAAARPGDEPASAGAAAWLALAVLVIATIVGAVDRQLLVLMGEPLKQGLGLSDTQLGVLQGAGITLLAGLAAFPLGWLADRHDRRLILAACVLLWSASTAACGLARDFPELLMAASGLGLGEAGLVPIVYSLIPDLFPRRQRATANAVYAIAAVFGAGIGIWASALLLSGAEALARHLPGALGGLEGWRVAFVLAASLGPLVALGIVLLKVRRHEKPDTASTPEDASSDLMPYLRRHARALGGIFGGMSAGSLGMSAVVTWLPVVAVRHFHVSVPEAGQAIGLGFAGGTLIGGVFAALQSRLRERHGVRAWARGFAASVGLAGLCAAAMPAMTQLPALMLLFAVQVAATFAGSVIYANLIQIATPARIRSRVLSMNAAGVAIVSAASPVIVGLLSDRLQVGTRPLLLAVAITAVTALLLGAVAVWRAEAAIVRTVQDVGG